MLESLDLDGQVFEVIKNLYWDQQASARRNGRSKARMRPLPDLFSLYTKMIMRNIREIERIRVEDLNVIPYADYTTLMADEEQRLQQIMDAVVEESERKGLNINRKQSFVMVFSKKPTKPNCNITMTGVRLEQVKSFHTWTAYFCCRVTKTKHS